MSLIPQKILTNLCHHKNQHKSLRILILFLKDTYVVQAYNVYIRLLWICAHAELVVGVLLCRPPMAACCSVLLVDVVGFVNVGNEHITNVTLCER